jgi:photosystem II stability/assembly factor-like uncharacterized protein
MKNTVIFFLIFITFILFSKLSYSQWTNQNPVPNGNDLLSTFFIDDNTGWIVGSEGFLKKTTNAGIDWIMQNSGTNLTLKSVQFVTQNTGWICGEGGLIIKTTDGGLSWIQLTSGTTEHLTDIHFCDLNKGYIVGNNGTILKTTNGGFVWNSLPTGVVFDLNSVDFVNSLVGYAVGGDYDEWKVIKTTNGGDSWVDKSSGIPFTYGTALSIDFIDANIGFIGGGHTPHYNRIYKTTNGGNTWFQSVVVTYLNEKEEINKELNCTFKSGGINSIYFMDSNTGFAVAGDAGGFYRAIYFTTDCGTTWNDKYVGEEEGGLSSIYVTKTGKGWAVGFNGAIFISENYGESWVQILSGNRYSCWTGDDLYSVFSMNENIVWAAGYRASCIGGGSNIILKTTDGGKIWKTKFLNQYNGGTIKSIYFANEYFGWAVGEGTKGLYMTTDGGENWIEDSERYSSVNFINQSNGWATKDDYYGGIFKSTDGGINWIQKSSVSSSSIFFLDVNNGWVVGKEGSVLRSTDGGETWTTKNSGTTNDLNCVKFYDLNLGMCAGNGGTVLLSTDGGESWHTQNSGTTNKLNEITFTNSSTVWIAGANGTILNTANLGDNWTSYDMVTENELTSISFTNENTGWFAGMNGTMFKYHNNVVPVELISFTAKLNNDLVQLNWQTATEINNQGFEIERCIDMKNWENIGFAEGHGTISSPQNYSFTDRNAVGGNKIKYRLKQVDFDGKYKYSNEVEVEIVPAEFVLYQNYPNPFNPSTKIKYSVRETSLITIKVFDIIGAEIETLVDKEMPEGSYEITWNAANLPSGVYFYQLKVYPANSGARSFIDTKKMMLTK